MSDASDFFKFLQIQIGERVIVEDELDLARLAALVPDLCQALQQTLPFSPLGAAALARAEQLVAEIAPRGSAYPADLHAS